MARSWRETPWNSYPQPWNHLQIEVVAMDMWEPYIRVVEDNLFRAHEKICFDKFHVAQHLGAAVDKVRRQENRVLTEAGDRTLGAVRE